MAHNRHTSHTLAACRHFQTKEKLHIVVRCRAVYGNHKGVSVEIYVHSANSSTSIVGVFPDDGTLMLRRFRDMPVAMCMPEAPKLSQYLPEGADGTARDAVEKVSDTQRSPGRLPELHGAALRQLCSEKKRNEQLSHLTDSKTCEARPVYMFYTVHT